jgi:hypothetical protein
MGEQVVKNITEPVRAYRIKGIGAGTTAKPSIHPGQGKSTEKPSIGVLQFQNLSKDGDDGSVKLANVCQMGARE